MKTCEMKCKECGAIHSYDCSTFIWECVSTNVKSMGTDNNYKVVIEDKCSCGELMRVIFSCWEYPEGVQETSDVEIYGATMVKNDCPSCPDLQ